MAKMKELYFDIMECLGAGLDVTEIAEKLGCPTELVEGAMRSNGLLEQVARVNINNTERVLNVE